MGQKKIYEHNLEFFKVMKKQNAAKVKIWSKDTATKTKKSKK